jgi:hypothetical protein
VYIFSELKIIYVQFVLGQSYFIAICRYLRKKVKQKILKSLTLFFKVIYCFYIVLLYFLKFIFLLCTICVLEHAIRGNVFIRFIFLNRYMEYFFFFPSYISFGLYLILYSYSIVIRS